MANKDPLNQGSTVSTTELYTCFNFARVEVEYRTGDMDDDKVEEEDNMIIRALQKQGRNNNMEDDE